jgi:hypothetical protein
MQRRPGTVNPEEYGHNPAAAEQDLLYLRRRSNDSP